jgi:hypothetical protein
LKVGGWFKGTPASDFEQGKVYVVEFWATWCGPCKRLIPHMTELAKADAGKATFIGVSIWEHPTETTDASIASMVKPFVEKMGDQMDYNVAADGTDHYMAQHWMAAAGQAQIPTAFVVGKDQHIAWIGGAADLGPVLDKVIAGQWDVAAEKKREAEELATRKQRNAAVGEVMSAMRAGNYSQAIVLLDQTEAQFPDLEKDPDLISIRLDSLLHADPSGAMAYIKKLTDKEGLVASKPVFVWSILRVLPKPEAKDPLKPSDWKIISDECRPMVLCDTTNSPNLYACYATVLSRSGDAHAAVVYQQKAVDLETKWNQANADKLSPMDAKALEHEQQRLSALTALDK